MHPADRSQPRLNQSPCGSLPGPGITPLHHKPQQQTATNTRPKSPLITDYVTKMRIKESRFSGIFRRTSELKAASECIKMARRHVKSTLLTDASKKKKKTVLTGKRVRSSSGSESGQLRQFEWQRPQSAMCSKRHGEDQLTRRRHSNLNILRARCIRSPSI